MILVDTSIWIEFFRKSSKIVIPTRLVPSLVVCSPVIQEVLQGIKDEASFSKVQLSLLNFKRVGLSLDTDCYLEAAQIYRSGRRRGITIRSSIDCLIAAIALKEKYRVWHQDRDFDEIAKFTELKIFYLN
jgi:predicted nucleic acid-binding protein